MNACLHVNGASCDTSAVRSKMFLTVAVRVPCLVTRRRREMTSQGSAGWSAPLASLCAASSCPTTPTPSTSAPRSRTVRGAARWLCHRPQSPGLACDVGCDVEYG